MTRRAASRAGARWQPVPVRKTMGAGATNRKRTRAGVRVPSVRVPHVQVPWRRYAVPVIVVAVLATAGWWLYNSPLMSIHGVSVQGNGVLPADGVREVAALKGESLVRPDFAAAEERLRALPLVKEAHVRHAWPFGAKITIVERAPWGVWQIGNLRYVIDDEGFVLNLAAPAGAPVITQTDPGVTLAQGDRVDVATVAVAKQIVTTSNQTLQRSVAGFEFSQAAGLTVTFSGDLRVLFGDVQGYDFKLATLFALLQKAQQEGRELHSVDLRFGNLVSVR